MEVLCEYSHNREQRIKSPINSTPNSTYSQTSWMCIFPNGLLCICMHMYVMGCFKKHKEAWTTKCILQLALILSWKIFSGLPYSCIASHVKHTIIY